MKIISNVLFQFSFFNSGTYEEVTNFLNGYLDNEVNLNDQQTCQNTCEDYRLTENFGCFEGTYCAQKPEGSERDRAVCKGKIVNCEFLGADLNICSSVRQIANYVKWRAQKKIRSQNESAFVSSSFISNQIASWIFTTIRCTLLWQWKCFRQKWHRTLSKMSRWISSSEYLKKINLFIKFMYFQSKELLIHKASWNWIHANECGLIVYLHTSHSTILCIVTKKFTRSHHGHGG